eukprot:CAMPEP_0113935536 /NCGR_PEP_ID=MMETSP1339-20121228/2684_1 /TAXON_ID=94617 /ORGANISM="Fibrocapsa japonica" /LENGTH=170 /DNA_ID=CAMNT_0000937735 /DNA_START=24 /DNA_END=532 /DNA_ORIENTATION=- /assembly_acc=CAM_ASM_000762
MAGIYLSTRLTGKYFEALLQAVFKIVFEAESNITLDVLGKKVYSADPALQGQITADDIQQETQNFGQLFQLAAQEGWCQPKLAEALNSGDGSANITNELNPECTNTLLEFWRQSWPKARALLHTRAGNGPNIATGPALAEEGQGEGSSTGGGGATSSQPGLTWRVDVKMG